jgi:hypothetical protein
MPSSYIATYTVQLGVNLSSPVVVLFCDACDSNLQEFMVRGLKILKGPRTTKTRGVEPLSLDQTALYSILWWSWIHGIREYMRNRLKVSYIPNKVRQ